MKKTFLARRNALFSSTDASWGVYALVGSLLILFVRLFAPNFFWYVFTPIFRSADFIAAESHLFLSSFGDTARLTLANEKLLKENAELTNKNKTLVQKEENLKALLGAPAGKAAAPEILAGVVARPPESLYDTLVLAEGSRVGVTLGMEAFGEGGVPIGVVSSVDTDFSRVTLFSSVGMTTHGWVGRANVPVTILGSGGGSMVATLARSADIMVDDSVFIPGPGQFFIGKVVRVDSDPASPAITLRIMPAINLFSVTWVVLRDTGAILLETLPQTAHSPL